MVLVDIFTQGLKTCRLCRRFFVLLVHKTGTNARASQWKDSCDNHLRISNCPLLCLCHAPEHAKENGRQFDYRTIAERGYAYKV